MIGDLTVPQKNPIRMFKTLAVKFSCSKKVHPRKLTYMDTQNDGLEKVTGPLKNGNYYRCFQKSSILIGFGTIIFTIHFGGFLLPHPLVSIR